ncbi:Laforin [Trichinella pseudospiralis]|uniref:Laforin n=1 Tax=Trichinella pseudospiralis TaxID=6337 RepID=A0A0V0XV44_TRIPS|nr:Laforin [Trichinella pseudospiralis]
MIFKFGLIRVLESVEAKLYLSGSAEELGAWDPDRAVLLHRISDGPVEEPAFWCTEVDIPSPKSFSYKFLLRFADGRLQWEGSGEEDNRRFDGSGLDDNHETHYMPPAYWIGSRVLGIHEAELLKFFGRLVTDKGIHFSKLDNNVWVGSCPPVAYLIHAKRMSTREAEYTLLSKRPVVYIDEDSLTGVWRTYEKLFERNKQTNYSHA